MRWMLMPLRRYADFDGRSRRTEYWMWVLFNILVYALVVVPLVFIAISAFHRVEARGGVRYHDIYGGSAGSYGVDKPAFDPTRDVDAVPPSDGGQSLENDNASDAEGAGDNDSGDAPDKVSELTRRAGDYDRVALVTSYGGGYRGSVSYGWSGDVDMAMFMQEFGVVGWLLIALYGLWQLVTIIPNLAVAIRRLHDTDRSGWWLLIGMVPLIGGIVLLVFLLTEGTRGSNRFGADPKAMVDDRTFA